MATDIPEPSKSERKRQARDLQNIGRQLAEIAPDDLLELNLSVQLADALANYRRFPSFEARRRQLQFIGKLMRNADIEPIQELLNRRAGKSAAARYEFHQLEQWRERLLTEPDALTEYLSAHPGADRQRLRQQLQRVRKARNETQRKDASRELFRILRNADQPA